MASRSGNIHMISGKLAMKQRAMKEGYISINVLYWTYYYKGRINKMMSLIMQQRATKMRKLLQ